MTTQIRARKNSAPGFIQTLRETRVKAGLSQADLGSRLGWTRDRVCEYESGYKAIHPRLLERWAAALGLRITTTPTETTEGDPT